MDSVLQPFVETPLNALLLMPILYLSYSIAFPDTKLPAKPPKEWREGYSWRPESHPSTVLFTTYTPKTLYKYNGNDDPRILLAIDRKVFDVTAGASFYGPGGPYGNFAGRDASRGMAKQSFDEGKIWTIGSNTSRGSTLFAENWSKMNHEARPLLATKKRLCLQRALDKYNQSVRVKDPPTTQLILMAASKSQKTRIKPSKPLTQYFTTLPPPSQPRKNSTKPITGSQSQSKPKDALPVKAATPAMHCSPKPTPPKPDTEYINISSDSSSASDKSVIVITSGSETSPPPNSPSPKSSKRSAAKGRVPTPMSIPSTDDEKPIIVEHVVISRHSSRISLSRNNSPHEGLGFAGQSPARRDTRSASSVPKHSPSAPFDPNQPYSGNSPASDARRNSLLSKRSASDSPPPCPLPTKKMKLSPSPSREPVYIFGDEIVPSSEGEEEVDLQPMARRCISAIHNDAMDGVVMNSSQTMPAQTGPGDDDENHISDTVTEARRLSFTNTITSEMEVSSQLRLAPDPSEIHMSSHPSPRDENADLSDAESFDSEKARINALNVKIEVEDADEPFDDSFLAEPLGVEVSPPRPAKTARSTNSEDDVEPKTPRRSSKPTSRLQLAMRSLITSSPLTDSSGLPYSEDLEATTNASSPMARHSPSPVKLPEDEVIVELPRLTRSQRRTYQSFIVPESKTTVAPTKGASNQPASRTSKQPRLQKSAAVLHPHSLLREAALSCLQDLLSSGADAVKDIELDFSTICRLLGGLGALDECLHLVAPEDKIETSAFRQRIPSAERDDRLVGLLKLVTLFAQLQQIYLADVPKIVLVLLLMSQDPRCTPEHKVDIANAIQWLFRNLGRSKKRAVQMEQTICCAISDIIEEWGIKDSLDLIRAIPRCEERGTRITRWVAFGKLAGSVFVDKRTEAQYVLTPPLSAVVSIVFGIADKDGKVPPASAHFAIEDHTDYDHLTSYMDLVGFILTNIDTYTKQDKGLETLDAIVEGLGLMTSRIIDKAGAKLERTRAKGEIQRLKIRLTYQSSTRSGPTTLERRSGKKVVRQASLTGFFTSKT
ncbi:hypothetical protein FRB99_004400 [Tulasnella sp. 403]|nr:hypothetical protein FRB99_004400 [Tulasnella sp. 403]